MKNLLTIALLTVTSTSAFALTVNDGNIALKAAKENIKKAIIDNDNGLKNILIHAQDIKNSSVKSQKVLEVLNLCSIEIQKNIKLFHKNEMDSINKKSDELNTKYAEYLDNLESIQKVKNCKDCDNEIKTLSINKYEKLAKNNLKSIRYESYLDSTYNSYYETTGCNFDQLFSYEDTADFSKYKNYGRGFYSASLTMPQIIENQFIRTLEFIGKQGKVKVKRDAKRIGSPSSSFNNGVVEIKISYNKSAFDSKVKHPVHTNPIIIIDKAL